MIIVEKNIKVSHDIDVVLTIFSDPNFAIPNIFPNIKEIKTPTSDTFEAEGSVTSISYKIKGRVYRGVDTVKYVYESNRGNGVLLIKKFDDNTITITLEHESRFWGTFIRFSIQSKLDNLERNIDELIRLERIKRKI